jgi:hypothetical protein
VRYKFILACIVIRKKKVTKQWQGCGKIGIVTRWWWKGNWYSLFGKESANFSIAKYRFIIKLNNLTFHFIPKRYETISTEN